MNKKNLWTKFWIMGSVLNYLKYEKQKNKNKHDEKNHFTIQ